MRGAERGCAVQDVARQLRATPDDSAAASAQEVASPGLAAGLFGYEPRFELHALVQRTLAERARLVASAAASLERCAAALVAV